MQIEILKICQSFANSFFDAFFTLITMLGEETFIVVCAAAIYWAVNKKHGKLIAAGLISSVLATNTLKVFFAVERPIGQPGIRTLRAETATGHSFPSGHSTSASSFFSGAALALKKPAFYFISAVIILLVGFSRLYLGVHWPLDVIAGICIGLLFTLVFSLTAENSKAFYIVFGAVIALSASGFWSCGEDFSKSFGLALGAFAGFVFEEKLVCFKSEGKIVLRILRVIVGCALLLALKTGLKLILPDEYFFHSLRYAFVGFFACGLYPLIFSKLKL